MSIAALAAIDDGTIVRTAGLLAELWAWDDGTENLLLVDTGSESTVWIVCSPSIRLQPSCYVHIGDEIEAVGEIFGAHLPRKMYADSDSVTLLLRSRYVLTVDALSGCWRLFEGDDIEVRGILLRTVDGGGLVLGDASSGSTVTVDFAHEPQPPLFGREVVVAGRLFFDEATMAVTLLADSIDPSR